MTPLHRWIRPSHAKDAHLVGMLLASAAWCGSSMSPMASREFSILASARRFASHALFAEAPTSVTYPSHSGKPGFSPTICHASLAQICTRTPPGQYCGVRTTERRACRGICRQSTIRPIYPRVTRKQRQGTGHRGDTCSKGPPTTVALDSVPSALPSRWGV